MKNVFKTSFFYFVVFAMVLGNSVLSIDFSVPTANAISVENPQFVEGNPSCSSLGYDNEFKLEGDNLADGTYSVSEGDVTLSNTDVDGGTFDWSSTFGIDAVIAKGGPNANLYSYDPSSTGNTGLVTPTNDANDKPYGLSHISFCYNDPVDCQLVVTKEYDGGPVAPGDQITYSLSITNNGTDDCSAVRLKDYFDIDNTSYVTADPVPYNVGDYYDYLGWSYSTMGPGESHQVSLTMEVKEDTCDSTIKNVARSLSHELGWTEDVIVETPIVCEEEPDYATVIAHKIVCDDESYLPDWATTQSDPTIDVDTATDFLAVGDNADHCELVEWNFEWAPQDNSNPGDNNESAGDPWTSFSGSVQIDVDDMDYVWVREVPNSNYIPFTGKSDSDPVSAEMYCNIDSFHYDNYERVDGITAGNTYYCVAFNVAVPSEYICGNYEQEPGEECDDGPNGSAFCTNECTLTEQPPICYEEGESFFASSVVSYEQGLRKDGSAVDANRSIPEQGLVLELGQNVSNFFSLGFGGWIIVSFDDIFVDGPGNDIKVTEDTWGGGYPLEKADVYVSQDGINWVFLGAADNTNLNLIHTTSEFDLGTTELTWGQYIKVVDTSDASVHSATADGYDLNAIEALSGGYIGECKEFITVCKVDEQENPLSGWEMTLYGSNLVTNGSFEYPTVVNNSGQWQLFTPAEVDWNVSWVGSHPGDPVLEYQTNLLGFYTPYEGNQYAELGSNFATKISQDITTVAGADYQLGFAFAPRNGSPEGINGDNQLQVKFGSIDETINANAGYTWTYHTFNSSAVDPSTTLEFIDTGFDNSYGTFVDNITLRQVATGITGEDGCVEFEVPYDTYEVRETLQEGWTQVYPEDPDYFTVNFNEENNAPVVTFVNKENTDEPTYDVHGYKWEDINGNGLRDCEPLVSAAVVDLQTPISECEPLLSGWTMNIYEGESSTPLMTMDTSSEIEHFGWYWFEGLSAGDYRICEELKDGWQQTYPEDCHLITLPSESSVQQTLNAVLAPEYNFGNQQLVEEKTYCGDGIVQTPNDEGTGGPENDGNEQCDTEGQACTTEDGYAGTQSCNMSSSESQSLACTWNTCVSEYYCGDGLLQESVEQCDHGPNGSSTCTTQCETIPEPPCTVNCGSGGGGGGGGPVGFSIRNLNSAVSCSGVELSWLTSQTSDTIVSYGTESGNYTVDINNDTNATGHSVVLNGLLPATTYYYQVTAINSSGKTIVVAEKSFTTPGAEQCGAVLGERIESPLVCNFLRASGSSGPDKDVEGVFTFPNGTLLRDACDRLETVYLIKDQKKWHVPNWKYLHDNHFGQRIYNVLSSVIKSYPDWTAQVLGVKRYADGTLLRGSDMKIYIIEDGKKHHITTFAELLKYAGQEIINVSDEVLNQY